MCEKEVSLSIMASFRLLIWVTLNILNPDRAITGTKCFTGTPRTIWTNTPLMSLHHTRNISMAVVSG